MKCNASSAILFFMRCAIYYKRRSMYKFTESRSRTFFSLAMRIFINLEIYKYEVKRIFMRDKQK